MIYKIRVILETEDDVFRDIDVKQNQTLWNLHEGIKSAFSLKGEELASFYKSNAKWSQGEEIPLEDMSDGGDGETMSDVYIKEAFAKVGDKMLFVYDFMQMWSFYVELLEIIDKKPIGTYPKTVYRFGKMPLKAPDRGFSSAASASIDDIDDVDMGAHLNGFDQEVESYDNEEDDEDDSYDLADEPYEEEDDI
ncbi:MAG: plasmid pRiA4b ORF-3 family protein [Flavobacteriaceae bacterium]|jgi:hypothetical protein|nr:plasmid pRiA4b ORF-3 family protein [Flavobacteriaceae bacterium]